MVQRRKMRSVLCVVTLLLSLTGLIICGGAGDNSADQIVVVGKIIAYDLLAALNSPCVNPVWIVRVVARISGTVETRDIIVQYGGTTKDRLPTLDDGKREWQFTLTRDTRCDGEVRLDVMINSGMETDGSALPRIQPTPGVAIRELPDGALLPCYILLEDGWQPMTRDR